MTPETHQKLADYLAECASKRFQWGVWDCCLFVADVIRITRGYDPAKKLRGTYHDQATAAAVIPVPLPQIPRWAGLAPIAKPVDGAICYLQVENCALEGLGVWWQGQAIQPGRRGLHVMARKPDNLKFYF